VSGTNTDGSSSYPYGWRVDCQLVKSESVRFNEPFHKSVLYDSPTD